MPILKPLMLALFHCFIVCLLLLWMMWRSVKTWITHSEFSLNYSKWILLPLFDCWLLLTWRDFGTTQQCWYLIRFILIIQHIIFRGIYQYACQYQFSIRIANMKIKILYYTKLLKTTYLRIIRSIKEEYHKCLCR